LVNDGPGVLVVWWWGFGGIGFVDSVVVFAGGWVFYWWGLLGVVMLAEVGCVGVVMAGVWWSGCVGRKIGGVSARSRVVLYGRPRIFGIWAYRNPFIFWPKMGVNLGILVREGLV